MKRYISLFSITAFLLLTSGCATLLPNERIGSITSADLVGQGAIAGRITLNDRSGMNFLGGYLGLSFYAYLHRLEDGKAFEVNVAAQDGNFFWRLPPGTYRVQHCGFTNNWRYVTIGRLEPDILVEMAKVTYVGDIHFEVDRVGRGYGAIDIQVSDQSEKIEKTLSSAGLAGRVAPQLIQPPKDSR